MWARKVGHHRLNRYLQPRKWLDGRTALIKAHNDSTSDNSTKQRLNIIRSVLPMADTYPTVDPTNRRCQRSNNTIFGANGTNTLLARIKPAVRTNLVVRRTRKPSMAITDLIKHSGHRSQNRGLHSSKNFLGYCHQTTHLECGARPIPYSVANAAIEPIGGLGHPLVRPRCLFFRI